MEIRPGVMQFVPKEDLGQRRGWPELRVLSGP